MKLLVPQCNKPHMYTQILFPISLSKPQAIPECLTKSNYLFMEFCKISLMYSTASVAFITVIVLVCLLSSYKYDISFVSFSLFGISQQRGTRIQFTGIAAVQSFPGCLSRGGWVPPAVRAVLRTALRQPWGAAAELPWRGASALTRLKGQSPSKAGRGAFVEKSTIPPPP